ncbi:MAG: acyl carrier protein [Dehalobacterium sp.]
MDKKFLDIVSQILNVDPKRLKEEDTTETLPEWDSLNHWAVISALEDEYGIEFTMDEATEFKNLGHIYTILMQKVANLS